jgi:asparagine synthase (glutamine-hydrolysing)
VAAEDLKVVLTGDGGDELFGGYERYRQDANLERWRRRLGPLAEPGASLARRLLGVAAPRAKLTRQAGTVAGLIGRYPDERYEAFMRIMPPQLVGDLLGATTPATNGYLRQPLPGVEPSERLDRLLRLDTLTYLPEDLLVKVDRATMAYSLEARSPLLDQELVAFAARLPVTRKRQAANGKVLLRSIAAEMLPEAILNRPKKGFSVPINAWFRGPLGSRFEEIGLAPDSYLREIVDLEVAARLLSAHRLGVAQAGHQLWLLLVLELWGRSWGRRIRTTAGASPAAVVH